MADNTLYTSLQWETAAREPKLFNTEALRHDKAFVCSYTGPVLGHAFSSELIVEIQTHSKTGHDSAAKDTRGPDGMTQLGLFGMHRWILHLPAKREGTV